MTQREFIAQVAKRSGFRQESVQIFLAAFRNVVANTLAKGEHVKLHEFGTFLPVALRPTRRRHTYTKEVIITDVRISPRFRAGKPLRELVAKKLTAVPLPNGRLLIKPR